MRLKTYCAWSLLGEISQALPTFPSDFESRTELNIATIQFLKARHISNIHGNLIVERLHLSSTEFGYPRKEHEPFGAFGFAIS
ncbi:hypothetical protein VitviT2T_005560 [Vitis vinifera]|uniref:Uncharacterized protein n=1 Tax=Vitis vinifera TaxID=29760 RepID=A0ABY9BTQ9_VITVI|nr:hypothetical protein VitviT2T_005560 [Vitis vinifera]